MLKCFYHMTQAHSLPDYVPHCDPEGTPFAESFEDSASIHGKLFESLILS